MDSQNKSANRTNKESDIESLAKNNSKLISNEQFLYGTEKEVLLSIAEKIGSATDRESLEEFVNQCPTEIFDFKDKIFILIFKSKDKLMSISKNFKTRHLIIPENQSFVKGSDSSRDITIANNSFKKTYPLLTKRDEVFDFQGNVIRVSKNVENQTKEIIGYKELQNKNLSLSKEILPMYNYSEIIARSGPMHKVFRLVSQVSESQSTVLLLGETGTGKELIARAIHNTSKRKDKVMIKVNCATLPASLIESELFGHEKGSFTGATERRIGKFELAHNGTLFLDEVGELPMELQVKLLRAIQEKEIERVGGRVVIKTDVRIIAATNKDLRKEVEAGNFRSDLYFRLDVFPIVLPPLRERIDDIPFLTTHFLEKHSRNLQRQTVKISSMALKQLMSYPWPGNVRELEHMIERSILLSNGSCITEVNIPWHNSGDDMEVSGRLKTIQENERDHIIKVLRSCKGKIGGIGGAAQILDLPVSTLNSRIKKLKIKKHFLKD